MRKLLPIRACVARALVHPWEGALDYVGVCAVLWLTSEWGIKVSTSALIAWQWTGYNATIYLAGL